MAWTARKAAQELQAALNQHQQPADLMTYLENWRGFAGGLTSSQKPNQQVRLSEILESNVGKRFYLSPRACQGILRRAEKRGKTLPPMLQKALEQVANTPPA